MKDQPPEKGVGQAVGWLVATRWVARGLGIGRTLILSSLLLPEDFGRAVLALSIVLFVEAITEMKVDYSLVRSRDNPDALYNAAWTIQIIRGFVCAVGIAVAAPWIGAFYGDPQLVHPIYLLSVALVIGGFVNAGMAQFYRDMDFAKIFLASVSSRVVALVVSVIVAWLTQSFWAILVGYVTQRVVDVLVSYLLQPRRPRLGLQSAGEIIEHSRWLLLQGILFQILLRADVFLIGKFAGPAALGPYYLAKMIAELIGTEFATAMRGALVSKFVRDGRSSSEPDEKGVTFQGFSDAALIALFYGAPFGVLLGLCAPDIVHFALDPQWEATADYLQIFGANAIFGVAAAAPAAIVLAAGQTRMIALRQAVGLAIFVPALWLGVTGFGLHGAAIAVLLTTMSGTAFSYVVAMREVQGRWVVLLKGFLAIGLGLLAVAVVAFLTLTLLPAVAERWHPLHILRVAAATCLALPVYGAMIWGQWYLRGQPASFEERILGHARALIRRLLRRA